MGVWGSISSKKRTKTKMPIQSTLIYNISTKTLSWITKEERNLIQIGKKKVNYSYLQTGCSTPKKPYGWVN